MEKFGSGMEKIRIRDKHPGSTTVTTLLPTIFREEKTGKKYFFTAGKKKCPGTLCES
jgi:hypothetical protein